jgi:hypothetical protein
MASVPLSARVNKINFPNIQGRRTRHNLVQHGGIHFQVGQVPGDVTKPVADGR